MLEKKIEFTDFNGEKQTEVWYFNLTKSELTEMELSVNGGMAAMLKALVAKEDVPEMLRIIKKIILMSVGIKSDDGRRFVKQGVAEDFEASPAFDVLYMEVATDAEKAAAFIKGLVPQELSQAFDAEGMNTVSLPAPAPSESGQTESNL